VSTVVCTCVFTCSVPVCTYVCTCSVPVIIPVVYLCVVIQSVIDEEAKGHSAKHVFISGQTTHITIEEEHPGGEDLHSESPNEDDDFDVDVQPLPAVKHGNFVS